MHDEGFLYVRVKLSNFSDWEFKDSGLYLGLRRAGRRRAATRPGPRRLQLASDHGLEEVLTFAGGQARMCQTESFRFWEPYRVPYSAQPQIAEGQPHILEAEDNRRGWFEPVVETNRRRVGRDGAVYPAQFCRAEPAAARLAASKARSYNDQALWNVSPQDGVIEVRMPWILLGFVGPHQMRVLQANADGTNGSEVSEGVGLAVGPRALRRHAASRLAGPARRRR